MSEVLEEFVEPYLDQTRNVDDMRTLYNLGVMAWNIANLPEPKQASELESLLKKVSHTLGGADAEVREIVTSLIDRKKTKFAGNRRIIIGFDLRDTGSAYQLSVISTLEP